MLLWGKMCAYLLSKDTFYYSASIKDKGYEKYIFWCLKVIQSHRKKIWVSTVHHVGEINCQTLKKTDSFWNNIPPGSHFSNGIKDLMKFLFTGKKKNDLTNNLFKMAHLNQ